MSRYLLKSVVAAAALALSTSAASAATVINLGTIGSVTSISDSVSYTSGETVTFKFTIDPYYAFTFTDSGSGGGFPFPIGSVATGGAGAYTETYGAYPVSGTLYYSLTTSAVPEPATWAMMLAGFGAIGLGLRGTKRRNLRTA